MRQIKQMKPGAAQAALLLCAALALSAALMGCERDQSMRVAAPLTVSVASGSDAKRLLPPLASDSASADIVGLVFNGLVKYAPDLTLMGELAESWDVSEGGLVITFHLRHGVTWHDGAPFTSSDVLFTYETVTDTETPTPYGANYGPVEKVEAPDEYTVRVTYSEPYAPAIESWGMGVMPRHLLEGKDISLEEYTRNPVGTGPFKFVQWDGGQKIVLEANDAYFEGRPNINRYVYRVIPDAATQFLELKSGGVDSMGLTPGQYKLQAGTPFFVKNFHRFRYPSFGYTYIGYNFKNPLFTDVRVRRALTHAINKEDIIKVVLMGLGRPCTGPFPPESWAYNPSVPDPAYDPAKSRALLAEAGFAMGDDGVLVRPDGTRMSFTVMTNHGNDKRVKAAQIIKEQLRAVGVEINIKIVEWQAMLELIDQRKFEAVMLGWALSRDPDLYEIWHSSKTGKREFNFVSYSNAEVDSLIVEGRQTFDLGRRAEVYRRIHEILAEEQPYTFLYVPDALPIVHARFKGIEQSAIGIWYDLIHWRVPANRAEWYQ